MYIDPAAGSLILQVLVAGVISALATMARARKAVGSFFSSLFGRQDQ